MVPENDFEMASEGGTFVSAAGGTFETVLGGTIKLLPSIVLYYLLNISILKQIIAEYLEGAI
jgi:hypothetical protein